MIMAYTLNGTDLTDYGITAGHGDGNIALSGCFDMPVRSGKTYHDWGDSDGIEPYTNTSEIFFEGRDIVFTGSLGGTLSEITTNLQSMYSDINAATGLMDFTTPYGTFSVYVKTVEPVIVTGGASVEITFREPVVTLTGTAGASGTANYTVDGIPFSSYGLYMSRADMLHDLPEMKEQNFTKYGAEGYQIAKRQNRTLVFNGFVAASGVEDFKGKISQLYAVFAASGVRNIKLNNETEVDCFLTDGFTVNGVQINGQATANINMEPMIYNLNYINYLLTEASEYITTEEGTYILI